MGLSAPLLQRCGALRLEVGQEQRQQLTPGGKDAMLLGEYLWAGHPAAKQKGREGKREGVES